MIVFEHSVATTRVFVSGAHKLTVTFFQANHGAYGIGSGGQLALGYLYSIVKPDMELAYAKRHARKAVEIASVLDANTGKPIQLVVQERM